MFAVFNFSKYHRNMLHLLYDVTHIIGPCIYILQNRIEQNRTTHNCGRGIRRSMAVRIYIACQAFCSQLWHDWQWILYVDSSIVAWSTAFSGKIVFNLMRNFRRVAYEDVSVTWRHPEWNCLFCSMACYVLQACITYVEALLNKYSDEGN